jgi:uncharacterized protein YfaT (DUF1175 family)
MRALASSRSKGFISGSSALGLVAFSAGFEESKRHFTACFSAVFETWWIRWTERALRPASSLRWYRP